MVRLPFLADYWSKDSVFRYGTIADKISRGRFLEIHRYLHFADNSTLAQPGSTGYNKLGKVQPIISTLNENYHTMYNNHRDVSIDEAMIPFKGRSTLVSGCNTIIKLQLINNNYKQCMNDKKNPCSRTHESLILLFLSESLKL